MLKIKKKKEKKLRVNTVPENKVQRYGDAPIKNVF